MRRSSTGDTYQSLVRSVGISRGHCQQYLPFVGIVVNAMPPRLEELEKIDEFETQTECFSDEELDQDSDSSTISVEIPIPYGREKCNSSAAQKQLPRDQASTRTTEPRQRISVDVPKLADIKQGATTTLRDSRRLERKFLDQHFERAHPKHGSDHWVKADLMKFTIYEKLDGALRPVSLHTVSFNLNDGDGKYYLSGQLYNGTSTQDVEELEICSLQIDNVGGLDENLKPKFPTCRDSIYLQTTDAKAYACFYLLTSPTTAYKFAFDQFLWLADFMKHTINYIEKAEEMGASVSLRDFESKFYQQLAAWYRDEDDFSKWHRDCGSTTDFRRHIACAEHARFIAGRADDIDDSFAAHSLWEDIGRYRASKVAGCPKTLVLAHTSKCFLQAFPSWSRMLRIIDLCPAVLEQQKKRQCLIGVGAKVLFDQSTQFTTEDGTLYSKASMLLQDAGQQRHRKQTMSGDQLVDRAVVARKHEAKCSQRPCTSCPVQFALVIRYAKRNGLFVKWLVLPAQTICAGLDASFRQGRSAAFYPIGNELFFTEERTTSIYLSDVVTSHTITVNQDHAANNDELFVHREYKQSSRSIEEPSYASQRKSRVAATMIQDKAVENESLPEKPRITSIFSGCGLLDHGLREGSEGLFEPLSAADRMYEPCLSLKANQKSDSDYEIHHGDVNLLFKEQCTGQREIGQGDLFAAGPPCPGYSILNTNRKSQKSQVDRSLLAHTLSVIERDLPRIVVIENVTGMDRTSPSAAGQATCHLVSLGYQVKLSTIKACDFGGATSRNRIFIIATAPGIALPFIPQPTHGISEYQAPVVTASLATSNLNPLYDDDTLNARHPDHVPIRRLRPVILGIVAKIPRSIPRGRGQKMCNISSVQQKLNKVEKQYYSSLNSHQRGPKSTTLRRVHPNLPKATITTKIVVQDCRGGGQIHWSQDRMVSLEELRRWQGVPPNFILVGTRLQQMEQVGNSVAWACSTLLGRLLGDSWRASRARQISIVHRASEKGGAGNIVQDLTDSKDEVRILDNVVQQPKTPNFGQVRVDVPSLASLRKRFRQSMSLEPTDPGIDIQEVGCIITNKPMQRESSGRNIENIFGGDELPNLASILTPTTSRSQSLTSGARSTKSVPTKSISLQNADRSYSDTGSRIVVRRRRSSNHEESDEQSEDESPSKRLRLDQQPTSIKGVETLRQKLRKLYDLEDETLTSRATTTNRVTKSHGEIFKGSSPHTPIVLED